MDLLEDLRMSFLNFNFVMIHIIHKILELLKNHLIYLKDDIFECFFKKYNKLSYFLKKDSQHIMIENPRSEEEKIIKYIRNRFRLKKTPKLNCN